MIPETVRHAGVCSVGAAHRGFGGFSADALRNRIIDCDAHVVITADGGYPDAGGRDRWWRIVEENKVSILYTARRRSRRS